MERGAAVVHDRTKAGIEEIRYLLFGCAVPATLFGLLAWLNLRQLGRQLFGPRAAAAPVVGLIGGPFELMLYLVFIMIPAVIYVTRPRARRRAGGPAPRAAAFVGTTMLLFFPAVLRRGPARGHAARSCTRSPSWRSSAASSVRHLGPLVPAQQLLDHPRGPPARGGWAVPAGAPSPLLRGDRGRRSRWPCGATSTPGRRWSWCPSSACSWYGRCSRSASCGRPSPSTTEYARHTRRLLPIPV